MAAIARTANATRCNIMTKRVGAKRHQVDLQLDATPTVDAITSIICLGVSDNMNGCKYKDCKSH